jgi:hypothetical protein
VLGEVPGFFHVGELYSFWPYSWKDNRRCGCDEKIKECSFWRAVISDSFGVNEGKKNDKMESRILKIPSISKLLMGRKNKICKKFDSKTIEYIEEFYKSIRKASGSDWIVDTSKNISYACMLACSKKIKLNIIHLVRDVRGVSYSWDRKDIGGWRPGLRDRIMKWVGRNLALEVVKSRLDFELIRVRYEDFARRPYVEVDRICKWLDLTAEHNPIDRDGLVELHTQHTAWGNPGRMKKGKILIKYDEEWRSGLTKEDRKIINMLTWPMLWRYGYIGWPR